MDFVAMTTYPEREMWARACTRSILVIHCSGFSHIILLTFLVWTIFDVGCAPSSVLGLLPHKHPTVISPTASSVLPILFADIGLYANHAETSTAVIHERLGLLRLPPVPKTTDIPKHFIIWVELIITSTTVGLQYCPGASSRCFWFFYEICYTYASKM